MASANSEYITGVFLLLVMSLNCISLIMATIVMNIKRRSQLEPVPKVPTTLLYVCETFLSRIACTRLTDWKKIATMPTETTIAIEKCMVQPRKTSVDTDSVFSSDDDDARIKDYLQLKTMAKYENSGTRLVGDQQNSDIITYSPLEGPNPSRHSECSNDSDQDEGTLCRTETTESTFSTASANDMFTHEVSYTDKLLATEGHSRTSQQSNAAVNHSFTTDKSRQEESLQMCDKITGANKSTLDTYTCSRNRSSYRRAIRHGSQGVNNYSSVSRQFRGRSVRRRSVFWGVSMKYQWYFVADVIDTTAFIIYVCVMFLGILTVLVIVPIFA